MPPIRRYMVRPPSNLYCRTKLRHQSKSAVEQLAEWQHNIHKQLADLSSTPSISDILQLTMMSDHSTNAALAVQTMTNNVTVGVTLGRPTSILSLPPEMLASIFKYLDQRGKGRASQVCQSWRAVAELKEVWRDTLVVVKSNGSTEHIYPLLALRGVHKIELDHSKSQSQFIMPPAMMLALPTLTHLVLNNCKAVGDDAVLQICRTFRKLVSLKLCGYYSSYSITDASIGHVCKRLKKLESLIIEQRSITDAGMKQLSTTGPPLRYLHLPNCNVLTDESFRYLSLGKQASLETLDLWAGLTGHAFEYISTMTRLKCVKLSMVQLCDHDFRTIGNMPSLRAFYLFIYDADNLDDGLEFLANGKSKIEKLILDCCSELTDVGMKHVSTMPHLRHLAITWCKMFTQVGLEHLLEGNKNLTILELCSCLGIGPRSFERIVTNQPNLQRLFIRSAKGVKQHIGKDILAMARQFPYLTYLNVDWRNLLHTSSSDVEMVLVNRLWYQ